MTGEELDPLAAVRADAAHLDALASGRPLMTGGGSGGTTPAADPALNLLAALRADVDAAVAGVSGPLLRRDTALLDALAAGLSTPPSADPAIELLRALRAAVDEVIPAGATQARPAAPEPAAPEPATAAAGAVAAGAVAAGAAALAPVLPLLDPARPGRHRRRILRTGVAAGSVALALSMSGVAAAAFDSHPGGTLYGLRTQTFGRTEDDPVAAQEVLADLRRQTAEAVVRPADPVVVAKARADLSKLRHYISAEHDPVAQRSIAASATTVVTTLAKLPAPVAPRSATPHPSGTDLAGQRPDPALSGRPGSPSPTRSERASGKPGDVPAASSTPREPDASPAADPSPSASAVAGPSDPTAATGSPTESPTGAPSASGSASAGPTDPSATPSGTPSAAPSASPIASTSPSVTAPATFATHPATPVARARPKAKPAKKKKVVATLMTAQLPTSGLPQR